MQINKIGMMIKNPKNVKITSKKLFVREMTSYKRRLSKSMTTLMYQGVMIMMILESYIKEINKNT